ncbi:MAG: RhoGAP domain-containing protein [Janthinobacterium lividum]
MVWDFFAYVAHSLILQTDVSRVDFRNPENFNHDVNSVAGLLKQFFRDLPDPLLTTEYYGDFIESARKQNHYNLSQLGVQERLC